MFDDRTMLNLMFFFVMVKIDSSIVVIGYAAAIKSTLSTVKVQ